MKIDATSFSSQPGSLKSDYLGSGSFAEVYDSKVEGYVLKEGFKGKLDKDMWLIWALYCMANKNMFDWMPKVEVIAIDHENEKFYALMEKLEEQEGDYEVNISPRDFLQGRDEGVNLPENIVEELKLVIDELLGVVSEDTSDFYIDGHAANIMVRSCGQIVLTDIVHKW